MSLVTMQHAVTGEVAQVEQESFDAVWSAKQWSIVPGAAGARDGFVTEWQPRTTYKAGEFVVNPAGFLVAALADFQSGAVYDPTKWSADAGSGTYAHPSGAWAAATAYTVQTMVTYNGAVYRCTTAHTSGTAFDLSKWEVWGAQPISSLSPRRYVPSTPTRTVLTTFQAGHGYTITGTGATGNVNDTGDYEVGTQSVRITTSGTGNQNNIIKSGGTPFDTTGKAVELLLKIDDPTHLSFLKVYLGSSAFANFKAISLFATSAGYAAVPAGEWFRARGTFAGAASSGALNRAAVTDVEIGIADDAAAQVTVRVGGLYLVPQSTALGSNGVVSLSFDDCWQSQWDNARPKLDQYAFQASIFPIIDRIGVSGLLTLTELQKLRDLHAWDVGAHAFTVAAHNGAGGFNGLSATDLRNEMQQTKLWLESNAFSSEIISYPQGIASSAVVAEAKQYFIGGRTTTGKAFDALPPVDPYRMRARSCSASDTFASIQADIDAAYAENAWLQLCFHEVSDSPIGGSYIGVSLFNQIIDYIATKGIAVRTITDVLKSV